MGKVVWHKKHKRKTKMNACHRAVVMEKVGAEGACRWELRNEEKIRIRHER